MKSSQIASKSPLCSSIAKLAFIVAVSGFATHQALAVGSLIYDLRAASVVGVGHVQDNKTVTGLVIGDVVTLNLFVAVVGADAISTNERYAFGFFGVNSNNGANGVLGNLGSTFDVAGNATSGVAFNTNFNGASGRGTFGANTSGDTGQDIGPVATNSSATNYANPFTSAAFAGTAGALSNAGTPLTGIAGVGQEFALGTVQFRVTALSLAGQNTLVNFTLPASLGLAVKANWQIDVATGAQTLQGVKGSDVSLGALAVPEPSAFGMLALGALGLVGFRRMGLRRTA